MFALHRIQKRSVFRRKSGYRNRASGTTLCCILLSIVFFLGLALGAIGIRTEGETNSFLSLFAQNVIELRAKGALSVAGSTFLSAFLMFAAAFLFGSSPFGLPILFLIPLIRGVGMGCVNASLLQSMGFHGLVAELAIFFFPDCATALLLIIFCTVSARQSAQLFSFHMLRKSSTTVVKMEDSFRLFLWVSLALFFLSLLAGLQSALFAPLLTPWSALAGSL